jgi:hypothetical protein
VKPTDNPAESFRDPLIQTPPTVFSGENPTFNAILSDSFERLESKRNLDTLRRIDRMEAVLDQMELDLDRLIDNRERLLPGGGSLGDT